MAVKFPTFKYDRFRFHSCMINGKHIYGIEVDARHIFEFCKAVHSAPDYGIPANPKDGAKHHVMRAYVDKMGHYTRFQGGNASPFIMIEKVEKVEALT